MWFKAPPGHTEMSIEQQVFKSEYTDEAGDNYIQVPDNFAPIVLSLNLGFEPFVEPPKGLPDNIPPLASKDRDGAIGALVMQIDSLTTQNRALVVELQDVYTQLAGAQRELEMLKNPPAEGEDSTGGAASGEDSITGSQGDTTLGSQEMSEDTTGGASA